MFELDLLWSLLFYISVNINNKEQMNREKLQVVSSLWKPKLIIRTKKAHTHCLLFKKLINDSSEKHKENHNRSRGFK